MGLSDPDPIPGGITVGFAFVADAKDVEDDDAVPQLNEKGERDILLPLPDLADETSPPPAPPLPLLPTPSPVPDPIGNNIPATDVD